MGEIIDFDFGEELGITGSAQAFDTKDICRWFDEKVDDGADERVLLARLVSISVDGSTAPGQLAAARARDGSLAPRVINVLCEAAGHPGTAPAFKIVERLADASPFLLEAAGLDEAKRDELLAAFPRGARVLLVHNRERQVIWSSVMRPPNEDEAGVLSTGKLRGKVAQAYFSLTRSCTPWCRAPGLEEQIKAYPAIPLLVVPGVLSEMGSGSAVAQFRRRR